LSTSSFSGNVTIALNNETVLGTWDGEREVEQTIGIPWLCEIPYLKYLFSTTTVNYEKSLFFLTVTAKLPDTASADRISSE
jgi:type II secretory pathway component GspD/PulD (secretin)